MSTWSSPRTPGSWLRSINAVVARVKRPIQFFHLPVPKAAYDDAYFAPLEKLNAKARGRVSISALSISTMPKAMPSASPLRAATREFTA